MGDDVVTRHDDDNAMESVVGVGFTSTIQLPFGSVEETDCAGRGRRNRKGMNHV